MRPLPLLLLAAMATLLAGCTTRSPASRAREVPEPSYVQFPSLTFVSNATGEYYRVEKAEFSAPDVYRPLPGVVRRPPPPPVVTNLIYFTTGPGLYRVRSIRSGTE